MRARGEDSIIPGFWAGLGICFALQEFFHLLYLIATR